MQLAEALAKAAQQNQLEGLTLFKTSEGWQASVRVANGSGYRVAVMPTPGAAVLEALGTPTEPDSVFA